jgi:hypothetical protein
MQSGRRDLNRSFVCVTSILGPILTEQFAKRLPPPADPESSHEKPRAEPMFVVDEHHALV